MGFDFNKKQDELNIERKNFEREMAIDKVSSIIQFINATRYVKFIWLALVIVAYFYEWQYLLELLFLGVVLSFIAQSFLTSHLEALIELRSIETDRNLFSVIANANKEIDKLEKNKNN